MMRRIRVLSGMAVAVVATAATADPPEFRAVVDDPAFEASFAALLEPIDKERFRRQASISEGLLLTKVTEGGNANRVGLEAGDVLLKVAGTPLWRFGQDWKRSERGREIVFLKPDGERKSGVIDPGRLGVRFESRCGPEIEYVRAHDAGEPWEDLVLGAIAIAEKNPDIAETALHRAVATGFKPDLASSALGIEIALRQNRPAEAWRYVEHIVEDVGGAANVPTGARQAVVLAGLACGKTAFLRGLAETGWGPGVLWLHDETLQAWDELEPPEHGWDLDRRPSERLSDYGLRERSHLMKAVTEDIKTPRRYPEWRNRRQIVAVTRGFWRRGFTRVEGGIRNCVWEVQFEAAGTPEEEQSNWSPVVRIYLDPIDGEKKGKRTLGGVTFLQNGTRRGYIGGGLGVRGEIYREWGAPAGMKPMRVRLIRLDDEIEVQVDGSTVLWVPCDPSAKDIGLWFFNSGMTVDMQKGRVWEIIAPEPGA